MTVSIYLAGSSRELTRVMGYAAQLEAIGLHISSKWWESVLAVGVGRDGDLSVDQQRKYALQDLRAVREADIVWLLWSPYKSRADFEFGYAYTLHARGEGISSLIVSGPDSHTDIFAALAFRDPSDGIALVEVANQARKLIAARQGLKRVAP